jgi:hypothetical protein
MKLVPVSAGSGYICDVLKIIAKIDKFEVTCKNETH